MNVTPPPAFEESTRSALQRLRSALSEAVAGIEGIRVDDDTPLSDLARHLAIDKKLAWKMGKVILTPDPFEAAQNLPGSAGLDIFLDAARRRGAPAEPLARVRSLYDEYRRLIKVHAGDKASFESMLARYADNTTRADIDLRRAAFRSNAYLFGVQARVQLRADFIHPARSGNDALIDTASVRGFIDLVSTRPRVEWPLGRMVYRDDDYTLVNNSRGPIDALPEGEPDDARVPLLAGFCSQPPPRIRAAIGPDGSPEAVMEGGAVGKTAAITCLTGEVSWDHGPRYRDEHNAFSGMAVRLFTPCEALVCDRYMHRSLYGRIEPTCHTVSELYRPATGEDDIDLMRLPMTERVMFLGEGLDAAATPLLPRQRELAAHVLSRLGWPAEEFLVYRLTVEYPVVPSCLFVRHTLPVRP